ncbi:MAG: FHA domain-containing protein [Candidatus Eremiobacteraeota bacterium]|nr:FHA domain-containing protein [Candidatus Eremiobacteraeota bacterium]MCW5867531.1 FHA domain-containing protein [Candidatus Eremiobacteraeota bacterium]
MADQDATLQVSARLEEGVRTSLELHVRRPDGGVEVYPFPRATVELELGEGRIQFKWQSGQVSFRNLATAEPVYKDGELVRAGRLEVGAGLEYCGHRVRLWDPEQAPAYLKGYSAPYSGEIWPLGEGEYPIGRPGQRDNAITLDHPTVSRKHATIAKKNGNYLLLAESATNPVCLGGQELEPGQWAHVQDGDLLEVGELVFRFQSPSASAAASSLIQVRSLGNFLATVGGNVVGDKDWKTQHIKWLFAHLAYEWGRPVAIEGLLEELWPDFPSDRSKNNLNYSLSTLRQVLRACLPEDMRKSELILRSSSSLQLNPELLDQHDVVYLRRQLALVQPGEDWERAAERAVLAYTGPLLQDCYLDWVAPLRQSLELEVLDVAKRLLEQRARARNWEGSVAVAGHVLQIDPCAQWACLLLMQALRSSQRAAEALRIFEQTRKTLLKELEIEPDLELLREHQKVLSALT